MYYQEASSSHQMPNVPELLEDSLANIISFYSLEFISTDDPNLAQFQPFDSTFSLVHWIRTYNNRGGYPPRTCPRYFSKCCSIHHLTLVMTFVKSMVDVENYGNQVL